MLSQRKAVFYRQARNLTNLSANKQMQYS